MENTINYQSWRKRSSSKVHLDTIYFAPGSLHKSLDVTLVDHTVRLSVTTFWSELVET